jgi:hypothetical protein
MVGSRLGVSHVGPARAARAGAAGVALVAAMALVLSGCSPTASPTPGWTAYPIGPTPWANGTTGQYGLRIDPSLLRKLPQSVAALPVVEDAISEGLAMDSSDLAAHFDSYAAATLGHLGDPDWLQLAMGHFKSDPQSPDTFDLYGAWVDYYATGACSQANAVASTGQEQIGDWQVDVATCGGGLTVYTLSLGNDTVLSMFGAGPKDIGRQLIEEIYF